MEPDFENMESLIDYLMENKALELYGMAESGEFTYRINLNILQEVLPKLYEMLMEDINDTLLDLYKEEYVEMEYDENLQPKFKLTEKGKEFLKNGNDIEF